MKKLVPLLGSTTMASGDFDSIYRGREVVLDVSNRSGQHEKLSFKSEYFFVGQYHGRLADGRIAMVKMNGQWPSLYVESDDNVTPNPPKVQKVLVPELAGTEVVGASTAGSGLFHSKEHES